MTNEPTGNYLVSATIGSDGKLVSSLLMPAVLIQEIFMVSTGVIRGGLHRGNRGARLARSTGLRCTIQPRLRRRLNISELCCQCQRKVRITIMYFGSHIPTQAGSNTVSVFAIDRSNPAKLSIIGKPVSSGGEFPNSLAINKGGDRVCVVNGGKVNGVR